MIKIQKKIFLITLIIFVGILLRVADLKKDPFYISASKAIFVDSGIYTFNAKQKTITDSFAFEEYNYHLIFPINTFISYIFFKIAGVDYSKLILFYALIGIITMFFFSAVAGKKNFIIALLFFSFSIVLITFNRSGMIENNLLLFFGITVFLFNSENKITAFLTGLIAVLGILIKSNFSVITAALLLYCIFSYLKTRKVEINYIAGIFAGIILILLFFLIFKNEYSNLQESIIFRHIFSDHAVFDIAAFLNPHFFLQSNFFMRELPVFALFLMALYKIILTDNQINKTIIFLICIFIFNIFFINLSPDYSPLRYRIFMIPAMIIIGIQYFSIPQPQKKSFILKFILLYLFFYPLIWLIIKKTNGRLILFNNLRLTEIILTLISVIIILRFSKYLNAFFSFKIFIILFLFFYGWQYYSAFSKSKYELNYIMNDISAQIKAGEKVIGWWAPQFLFNRVDITVIPGNPYPKYLEKYSPELIISNTINQEFQNYKLIKEYNIPAIKQRFLLFKKN